MKYLHLVLSLLLLFSAPCDPLRLSISQPNGQSLSFKIQLPKGYTMVKTETGTDIDELYCFEYGKHCMIYVSNGRSPNIDNIRRTYAYPELSIPITNNHLVKRISDSKPVGELLLDDDDEWFFNMPDTLVLEGKRCMYYWKEIEYTNICIGYTGVPSHKKNSFDEALSSFIFFLNTK